MGSMRLALSEKQLQPCCFKQLRVQAPEFPSTPVLPSNCSCLYLHFTLSTLILFFKPQLPPSPGEFCWPLAAVFHWKALL